MPDIFKSFHYELLIELEIKIFKEYRKEGTYELSAEEYRYLLQLTRVLYYPPFFLVTF